MLIKFATNLLLIRLLMTLMVLTSFQANTEITATHQQMRVNRTEATRVITALHGVMTPVGTGTVMKTVDPITVVSSMS